jgi:hypothetical protein
MNGHVQPSWSAGKSEDFSLKDFALGVLEIAKENLQRDGDLVPAAFIVTGEEIQCVSVNFADHEEKAAAYAELVTMAQQLEAVALVTCNDAFWKNKPGPEYLDGYYPGRLAAEGAKECIMLTVSGPAMQTWCVDTPYERLGNTIRFGESSESFGEKVGFLENWRTGTMRVQ